MAGFTASPWGDVSWVERTLSNTQSPGNAPLLAFATVCFIKLAVVLARRDRAPAAMAAPDLRALVLGAQKQVHRGRWGSPETAAGQQHQGQQLRRRPPPLPYACSC